MQNKDERIQELEDCVENLISALEEIKKGAGAYDMDKLKHASNTIENMKEIAETAIRQAASFRKVSP
ncbi:hypothetical protein GF312_00595 [Candidatus Poribacteria bacterium]|nr:hypothetical protein [Candidatus Poribacteria bacterium]